MKKNKFKISFDVLFTKRVLVILSIISAIVLWAVVLVNVSPAETKVISNVPIIIDTEALTSALGLEAVEIVGPQSLITKHIDVELSGRRYALSQITAEDITVTAQVSGVSQRGIYPLALSIIVDSSFPDIATTANNSQYISVRFDLMKEVTFQIEKIQLTGAKTAKNSDMIIDAPFSDLKAITLRGPELDIDAIASVAVVADVNQTLSETSEFAGKIILYDKDGNEVAPTSRLSVEGNQQTALSDIPVQITVPVKKAKQVNASISLKAKYTAENFNFAGISYSISPKSVTVKGEPAEIDAGFTTDQLLLGEIDLSTVGKKSRKFTFTPSLTTGTSIVEDVREFTVNFPLKGYSEKTFVVTSATSDFSVLKEEGKNAVFDTKQFEVTVVGPTADVNKIKAESIAVVADISGMDVTGKCSVPAYPYVKNSTTCWVYGSYMADVVIS
ncbi:MAG: hypothetical protein LBL82_08540 [Oscillospiraceae bacterium]|jgi:hypothetical protein|nr:hypothetical protein [Oscillospiraceae bacterium]